MIGFVADEIDINGVCSAIKKQYPRATVEQTREILENTLRKGIVFKERNINIVFTEFDDPLFERRSRWYFFQCPLCDERVKKIFYSNNNVGCRHCLNIKNKRVVRTDSDRVLKIQEYLNELFTKGGSLSAKRKRIVVENISTHYKNLGEKYKIGHNAIIFKELQNWCFNTSRDKTLDPEYRRALKDMLCIFRTAREILIKSKMVPRKKL